MIKSQGIIGRYWMRHLVFTTIGVTVLLTLAVWMTQSLRFMSMILLKGISLSAFFMFMLWVLPDLILLTLPIGFLASVLFLYHKWIGDHSFVSLKTMGCPPVFFLRPVLLIGGIGTFFLYTVSLYLMPLSFQQFRLQEKAFRSHFSQAMIHEGEFNALGSVMVYAHDCEGDGTIKGLFVYDARKSEAPVTFMAEKAVILDGSLGLRIVLQNGTRVSLDRGQGIPSLLQFDRYTVTLEREKTEPHIRKPYEMFLPELLDSTSKDRSRNYSEAYQRLLMPLYMLSFGVLAALILICSPESRGGRQKAILFRCVSAFGIEIFSLLAIQSAALDLWGFLLGGILTCLPLFWALSLTLRTQRTLKRLGSHIHFYES